MKNKIVETLSGKEKFDFLIAHKSELIAEKKSIIKESDIMVKVPEFVVEKQFTTKAAGATESNPDVIRVKIVANTANWMDSQGDVLLPGAAKKSIRERKGMIPHLKNHEHKIDSNIGDVVDIYLKELTLKELGLKQSGSAEAIIMESDVRKDYDPKAFLQYKEGRIKQHSIGLQYVKLLLAINDEEYDEEFDIYNKYIGQIINRKEAEEQGYFWVVPEFKLLENSAVLFGSNFLTPTLEVKDQPDEGTHDEPPVKPTEKSFDVLQAIQKTNFIKL